MAQNLEDVKNDLYEAFTLAMARGKSYMGESAQGWFAAAELAKAIVQVEEKLERKNGLKLPGKG